MQRAHTKLLARLSILLLVPFLFFPIAATANKQPSNFGKKFTASVSAGNFTGRLGEFIFAANQRKLSQLDWWVHSMAIIKGSAAWNALSWLTLGAHGWVGVDDLSANTMDDLDWVIPGQIHWTDWSHHDDTRTDHAYNIDLYMVAWFLSKNNCRLGFLTGYLWNSIKLTSYGATFDSGNGSNVGIDADGERGIAYEQNHRVFYIGLSGEIRYKKFVLNALFKFSDWVSAKWIDDHFLRNWHSVGTGRNAMYYAGALMAGLYVTPRTKIFLTGSVDYFPDVKSNLIIRNTKTGGIVPTSTQKAGLSDYYYTVLIGVQRSLG